MCLPDTLVNNTKNKHKNTCMVLRIDYIYNIKQQLTPRKMTTTTLIERITIRLNESQNYDNNGNPVDREFGQIIDGCTDELEAIQAKLFIN